MVFRPGRVEGGEIVGVSSSREEEETTKRDDESCRIMMLPDDGRKVFISVTLMWRVFVLNLPPSPTIIDRHDEGKFDMFGH